MSKNFDRLDEAIIILSQISTANISDAMAKGLSRPFKHQTMDPGIKPVCPDFKVCGPAYTVRCYPGATYAMEKAVAEAPEGTVIVCDGQCSDAGVMMGGLMSTFAQKRGIRGAVIDGAIRDVEDIIALGFPLFARHIVARSGTFAQLGDLQEVVTCGLVVVNPGDIIIGDIDGVVVVPHTIARQVAKAAEQLVQFENAVRELLLQGKTLEEAAGLCEKPAIEKI